VRRRLPSLRETIVPYDGGRSRIIADLGTALGLGLYRYGHHDPEVALVGQYLRPGEVFVDGGANVGLYTLVAAAWVGPTGTVIALEPASWARRCLERNVALNGFHWVKVQPVALADAPGKLELVSFQGDGAGLSSFQPPFLAGGTVEQVQAARLDDVLPADMVSRVALVKLDLEGAEYRALQGATTLLHGPRPDFFVEVDPGNLGRQGASAGQVLTLFRECGYRCFFIAAESPDTALVEIAVAEMTSRPTPNLFFTPEPGRARARGIIVRELP
jgi:FkbM family methyltransferase